MFEVIWNCRTQAYRVYKNGRYLLTVYNVVDAQNYSRQVVVT